MIRRVSSDSPSFKDIGFEAGLNIVLAERTTESSSKDTRNGLGKSTLVEVIHFCLGSSVTKDRGLADPHIAEWTFTLEFDLGGQVVRASRTPSAPRRVRVEADPSSWPIESPELNKQGELTIDVQLWNRLLGHLMFGLPVEPQGAFAPSFRSLISFFIRRGRDAFSIPFEHFRKQAPADKQVNNAYLLGLSWQDARDIHLLKERKKLVSSYRTARKQGILAGESASIGHLEAERVALAARANEEAKGLSSFSVHPQYHQIEKRVSQLTQEMGDLANEGFVDRRSLEAYERSIGEEREPAFAELSRLYAEANVVLPGAVTKRLEDLQSFHARLIANRKAFLEGEIERLRRAIAERDEQIRNKSEERAALLLTLKNKGALEEYTQLQLLHSATSQQLAEVEGRIASLRELEKSASELRVEGEDLRRRAKADYDERKAQRERAISLFNSNSQRLYEAPGILVIDVDEKGYSFDVDIQRRESSGISSMKVFCYDLMLAELWANRPHSPGFLVHDSDLFESVDSRQRALALELASQKSEELGFQYICLLNSDQIPVEDLPSDFDVMEYVRSTFTDAKDDGGLLGIRF